jgi:ribosomal protein L39E
MYNGASNTYSSFQSIARSHNKYVRHDHRCCGAQKSRRWLGKAKRDRTMIARLPSRLAKTTKQQRRLPAYHDLLRTVHDLRRWSGARIMPRLLTCRLMPISSSRVAHDLYRVAIYLGLGGGY